MTNTWKLVIILFFLPLFIALFSIAYWPIAYFYSKRDVHFCTVKLPERVCSGGKITNCKYLVFTDKGVFENTDSLLGWKFNSSDIHAFIKDKACYKANVYGWRIPFLSKYPNILTLDAADEGS